MTLQNVCTAAGCIFIISIAISVLLVAIMRFRDWREERYSKTYNKAMEIASRQLGFRLVQDACWMSEYPQVMLFMQVYGEAYRDNFQSSIESVRKTFQERT